MCVHLPARPTLMTGVVLAVASGALAGACLGAVLQRGGLCFHSMFAGAWRGSTELLRGWLLGVAVAAVGLALVFALPWADRLNQGLAFRPVQNVVGGLVIGVGMVVARSCVSGLFYKLGSGMLGASVGLLGWAVGELVAARVSLGGPTLLSGGEGATLPGVLGIPRLPGALVVAALLVVVCLRLSRRSEPADPGVPSGRWSWPRTGLALGAVTVAGWVLAGVAGASFGPSTVGAVQGVRAGTPNAWLIAFLAGLVLGGWAAARASGELWVRGESRGRYPGLLVGGALLGAGGWIAGGCNLGHGLSGAAQLNVSSWVVVAAMATGVLVAGRVGSGARIRARR